MTHIILASSSTYRRQLLQQLGFTDIQCLPPSIDETPIAGESAATLAERLALEKAQKIANSQTAAAKTLVIGADQTAVIEGETDILGKPGHFDAAVTQLQRSAGKRVTFYTGLCVINTESGRQHQSCTPFSVQFRPLTTAQISNYISREQPYDCAGSFKSEGLGIALFSSMQGEDPNALIGLPLIALCSILEQEGCFPLDQR